MTALQPVAPRHLAPLTHDDIVTSWLSGRSETTFRAYQGDLKHFAAWLGFPPAEAVGRLCELGNGGANRVALAYRAFMVEESFAPATINRRLAALRSVLQLSRQLGHITWGLDVPGVDYEMYRDTRGPGLAAIKRMIEAARDQKRESKAARDVFIIRLLFDLGLRNSELRTIDLEHLDSTHLRVKRKGKGDRVLLTMPAATVEALGEWMHYRGHEPGPLIPSMDNRGNLKLTSPMSDVGLWKLIKMLGRKAGVETRPHGIRHTAATELADKSGGDALAIQKFLGHSSPAPAGRYIDNLDDKGGKGGGVGVDVA